MKRRSYAILTIALMLVAGIGCGRKAVVEETKTHWMKLRHTPIEEAEVGSEALVDAETEVSPDTAHVEVYLYYRSEPHPYQVVQMNLLEPGKYFAAIPTQSRGTLIEYYIEARAGSDIVVRVPRQDKKPGFSFYYKGVPNRALLVGHAALMFTSLFLFLLSGYLALRAIKNRRVAMHVPRLSFLGSVVFFISSFPLGMPLAYQRYGTPWTGFPVGSDLTDNKSLAIILYWAAAAFFYRGSVFRKDPSTDLLPMRSLPYVYLVGVLITITLFVIPH
jgi:hypothetical protein